MNERIEELIKRIVDLPLSESMQVLDGATNSISKMLDAHLEEKNVAAKEALQRYEEFSAFKLRNTPKVVNEAKRSY